MNKSTFLKTLTAKLATLPEPEVQKSLNYYSEMIADYMEEGMLEEDAVARLGDINAIAARVLADSVPEPAAAPEGACAPEGAAVHSAPAWEMPQAESQRKTDGNTIKILLVLLIIFSSPVWIGLLGGVFGIVVAIAAVLFSFVLVAVVLGITGLVLIAAMPFFIIDNPLSGLFVLGGALVCIGGGIILFPLTIQLVRWAGSGIRYITRWLSGLFERRRTV